MSNLKTADFVEAQAVMVCCVELEKIERLHRYKLSKALAFSLFLLNVVGVRLDEDNPRGISAHFENFTIDTNEFFSHGIISTDPSIVNLKQILFWLRNRITHFEGIERGDNSRGGLVVDPRAGTGIRGFTIRGSVSGNPRGIHFEGHTDRRRLTMLLRIMTDEYIAKLGYKSEFAKIEKHLRDDIQSVEREA